MSPRWVPIAKAVASLCLLAWLANGIDAAHLGDLLQRMPAAYLVLALLLLLLQIVLMAHRWHRIVAMLGGHVPWRAALHWVFVGHLLSMVLPTSVGGDVYRVWRLHRLGTAQGLALGSVMIERLSGLTLVGLLVSASAAVMEPSLSTPVHWALVATGPLLVGGLILLGTSSALPERAWLEPVKRVGVQAHALLSSPATLTETAAWGLAGSLSGFAAAWVLARGLGIEVDFPGLVAIAGGAALLAVLPVSVGGWGVREAGMVGLFAMLGVAAEPALALSVLWAALPVLLSLVGAAAMTLLPGFAAERA